MALRNAPGFVEGSVLPSASLHSSMLKPCRCLQSTFHRFRNSTAQRYMPMGPTEKISTMSRPSSLAPLICRAISWPIRVLKSSRVSPHTGEKSLCHHGSRLLTSSGFIPQQRSIFARSHAGG